MKNQGSSVCWIVLQFFFTFHFTSLFAQPNDTIISPEILSFMQDTSVIGNFPGADAIILLHETKIFVDEEASFEHSEHVCGKVLTENGKSGYSHVVVPFNSFFEEVSLDFARTIKEDGSIVRVSEDAIQLKTGQVTTSGKESTDQRLFSFLFSDLQLGDVFEYQVTLKQKKAIIPDEWFGEFYFHYVAVNWLDWNAPLHIDPVRLARVELQMPHRSDFNQSLQGIKLKPKYKRNHDKKVVVWEIKDLTSPVFEAYMPNLNDLLAGIRLSSLDDWSQIDQWASTLVFDFETKYPEINALADSLTRNAQSDNAKIAALYRYVQEEIDYAPVDFGRGGLIPQLPSKILIKKYGDCKDKASLLVTLLDAVGIDAYPALINPIREIDLKVASPQPFNHAIVYIPREKKDIWLDPTSEVTAFPNLFFRDTDKWAFVINGKGGEFIKTPQLPAGKNQLRITASFLSENGKIKAFLFTDVIGGYNDLFKSFIKPLSGEQKDELIRREINATVPGYQIQKSGFIALDNQNEELKMFTICEAKHELDSGVPTFIYNYNPIPGISLSALSIFALPSPKNREHDAIFPMNYKIICNQMFRAPSDDYKAKLLPPSDSVNTLFLDFSRHFKLKGDTVLADWELTMKEKHINKKDYPDFYASMQDVLKKLNWGIEFEMKQERAINAGSEEQELPLSILVVGTKQQANLIWQKLDQGEEFEKLAKQESIGLAKEKGGDLGKINPDDLMEELRTTAVNLQAGEYSSVIETPAGFFIIKRNDEAIASEASSVNSFQQLLEKGKAAYKNEFYLDALRYLGEAAELEPENPDVHYYLALTYIAQHPKLEQICDWTRQASERISEELEKVIQIKPDYQADGMDPYTLLATQWGHLAISYTCQGKADSVRWAFERGKEAGAFYPVINEIARNLMASCEENAILFTDALSLFFWYLQLVKGYRTDISVVYKGCLNFPWYAKAIRHENPLLKNAVIFNLKDDEIDALKPLSWRTRDYSIAVKNDPMNIAGMIKWTLKPTYMGRYLLVPDQLLIQIIESNQWQKPIYTNSPDDFVNLDKYLTREGLLSRLSSHEVLESSTDKTFDLYLKKYTFETIRDPEIKNIPAASRLIHEFRKGIYSMEADYSRKNQYPRIIRIVEDLDPKFPPEVIPLLNKELDCFSQLMRGLAYLDDKQYDKAIGFFKKGIAVDPTYIQHWIYLGKAYLEAKDYDEAIAAFDGLLALDSSNKWGYLGKGDCKQRLEENEEALALYEKATRIDSTLQLAYLGEGIVKIRMEQFDEAKQALEKAIELDSINGSPYANLGWMYYKMGDYSKCIEYSEKAIGLDSTALAPRFNRAIAYLCLHDFGKAKEEYTMCKASSIDQKEEISQETIDEIKRLLDDKQLAEQAQYVLTEILGVKDD